MKDQELRDIEEKIAYKKAHIYSIPKKYRTPHLWRIALGLAHPRNFTDAIRMKPAKDNG